MVAPHGQFLNVCHGFASLGSHLTGRAVVVQAQHGGKVFTRQIWRAFHGNPRVSVGRIAHHQHLDVAAGHGVQRLALSDKNRAVHGQQFSTLHARTPGA